MLIPWTRAQRCRDLAEKCRAIVAMCDPSTEMQTLWVHSFSGLSTN